MKETEHPSKNMKELQRDNMSHMSVEEKTSRKGLKLQQGRFRAEVMKGFIYWREKQGSYASALESLHSLSHHSN